jgi:hypothetical protein
LFSVVSRKAGAGGRHPQRGGHLKITWQLAAFSPKRRRNGLAPKFGKNYLVTQE